MARITSDVGDALAEAARVANDNDDVAGSHVRVETAKAICFALADVRDAIRDGVRALVGRFP